MRALPTDVFVAGREGYHTYRIPALLRVGRRELLAVCEGRRDGSGDAGKIDLVCKRSTDGGKTWGKLKVIHGERGRTTIGNPVPILARDGVLHLVCCRNNASAVLHMRSTNGGRTWSRPRRIATARSLSRGFGFAVQRFGTGPCHGVQLAPNLVAVCGAGFSLHPAGGGRLIVPIWLRSNASLYYRRSTCHAGILYSDDGGRTWSAGGSVGPGASEAVAAQLPDGTLLLNCRPMGKPAGYRHLASSTDGGLTFTRRWIDRTLIDPNCQASMIATPAGKLVFCNPARRNRKVNYNALLRRRLTIRISPDGGRTWPHRRVIDPGPAGYCDLACLAGGSIGILYERGRWCYHERIAFTSVSLARASSP